MYKILKQSLHCNLDESKMKFPLDKNCELKIFNVTSHMCSDVHLDGFVQERRNSSALAMELRLSCINP